MAALVICCVVVWGALSGGFGGSESLWYPLLALCVVVLAVALARGLRRPELLRIDRGGVSYGEVMVPWRSVYQIVVFRSGSYTGSQESPQLGVRLNPGAALPPCVTVSSAGIGRSEVAGPLRTRITGARIDVQAAFEAVHRFAPDDVALVEQLGDEERVLRR